VGFKAIIWLFYMIWEPRLYFMTRRLTFDIKTECSIFLYQRSSALIPGEGSFHFLIPALSGLYLRGCRVLLLLHWALYSLYLLPITYQAVLFLSFFIFFFFTALSVVSLRSFSSALCGRRLFERSASSPCLCFVVDVVWAHDTTAFSLLSFTENRLVLAFEAFLRFSNYPAVAWIALII
jgi:hypothetical protein